MRNANYYYTLIEFEETEINSCFIIITCLLPLNLVEIIFNSKYHL